MKTLHKSVFMRLLRQLRCLAKTDGSAALPRRDEFDVLTRPLLGRFKSVYCPSQDDRVAASLSNRLLASVGLGSDSPKIARTQWPSVGLGNKMN